MFCKKLNRLKGLLALCLIIINPTLVIAQDSSESIKLSLNKSEIIDVQQRDLDVEIKIDGKIDEVAWRDITPFERMKVSQPDTFEDPIYKSVVRFFIQLMDCIFP